MNKTKFSLDIEEPSNETIQNVDRTALKNFAQGASDRKLGTGNEPVWQDEDPNELPSYNFRLRLNKYQIGLLKHVANQDKRSVSNMVKLILMEELTKRIK